MADIGQPKAQDEGDNEFNPEDFQPPALPGTEIPDYHGGGRGGQPDTQPASDAPAPGEEPTGGGTIEGGGPDSGVLSKFSGGNPTEVSQNTNLGGNQTSADISTPPQFTGNGYTFIAPGVAFGNMTPGGTKLPEPGYSYFHKGSKSWMPVSQRRPGTAEIGRPAAAPMARPTRSELPQMEAQ